MRRLGALLTMTAVGSLTGAAAPAFAASSEPAKGAPIGDVIWGTVAATAATALVIWVASAHRSGRISWLRRAAEASGRVAGLPPWTALPGAITGVSLIVAGFGFYWDVAKHIDTGRDPSPFGTPAHYPILFGLFGITVGGFTAIVLGTERDVPTSLRIAEDWRAPLGGALIFLCGAFALSGFPLDDVWHTLFGQDVTLWGPTHVLMIAGASLSSLGVWVLLVEGRRTIGWSHTTERKQPIWLRLRVVMMAGGFLVGLSTLQGEFDYGVPQFQLVYQPILIMLAAGVGLVAARLRLGRFGALQAVGSFLAIRGLFTLVIGPGLGLSTLHMPLYVVEAVLVELAALAIPRGRALTLGVVSGALIGTIGLAAEWGWSHVWMPLPWPSALFPEAAILGFAAALAGGVLGGYIGRALLSGERAPQRGPRWLLPAAALVALFCIAFPLPMNAGSQASASFTLRTVAPGPHRTADATIGIVPASAARDSEWLTMTAWQGGALQVDRLHKIGPGAWRTTQPIPVYGKWKAMLRLENGRGVRAVPVYLPEDKAIPAREVPATAHFTRPFVRDKKILQREAVGGATWLTTPAYLLLLAIATLWLVSLGLGLRRLEVTAGGQVRGEVTDAPAGATRVSGGKVRTA
jgi:hypothetical protein